MLPEGSVAFFWVQAGSVPGLVQCLDSSGKFENTAFKRLVLLNKFSFRCQKFLAARGANL